MQITPFKINYTPLYNQPSRNIQYPRYNNYLEQDTVCFTSTPKISYKEQMYKEWDERMTDTDGFGIPFTRFHCIEGYDEAAQNFEIKKFIRLGGESAVFELEDGNILKLSAEKYPPHIEKYHAPEIERGEIELSKTYIARNDKPSQRFNTNKVYYLIQKKGIPLTDAAQSLGIYNAAEKDGFKTSDFAATQFAYFDTDNDKKEIKCIDLSCITDKDYSLSRDFEAIERMTPQDICKPYGMTFFTLKKYFKDMFADSDDINKYLASIKPRIDNGENIFDVVNEVLTENNKEQIKHIE